MPIGFKLISDSGSTVGSSGDASPGYCAMTTDQALKELETGGYTGVWNLIEINARFVGCDKICHYFNEGDTSPCFKPGVNSDNCRLAQEGRPGVER